MNDVHIWGTGGIAEMCYEVRRRRGREEREGSREDQARDS